MTSSVGKQSLTYEKKTTTVCFTVVRRIYCNFIRNLICEYFQTNLKLSIGSVDLRLDESLGKTLRSVCNRHAKEFRKAAGIKTVPELQEVNCG